MLMALSSRFIFTAIGVTLPIAAHKADMNETHIYNPHWPPPAKFNNGQTLSMSLLLGGLTTLLAWWPSNNVPAMVLAAAGAASLYFISQSAAILYPNTAYFDPEFKPADSPGSSICSRHRCGLPVCGRSCVVVGLPRSPVKVAGP
jgi:hypothetical protein